MGKLLEARAKSLFYVIAVMLLASMTGTAGASAQAAHPSLLFSAADLPAIKQRAKHPILAPVAQRLIDRADRILTAPPIVPSITGRGEPDPPGESKGIASARRLQGDVITLAMAFTLAGDRRYRDRAVALLFDALDHWRIWVDTAHQPPYDLMTGENAMTFGLAYDWLYQDLTPAERRHLRDGVSRRALQPYLDATTREKPMFWFTASHNWNTVCNGGAAVLALAFAGEFDDALAERVLGLAAPSMRPYWDHLKDDGGWDEGTGYWTYGHRYALIAAEALRRRGQTFGDDVFARPGVRRTGDFPIAFAPGRTAAAGFGDSNHRASDAIFYLLARAYKNADYVWFEDREAARSQGDREGDWPLDALTLLWRPVDEPWLPEANASFTPSIAPVTIFPAIGWGMMAARQPDPPFFLAFKNGSLAANHTHLDLNAINVGVGETMVLRELGSRPYPADYFGPKRYGYYEITTAGHNTVLIGGRGQTPGTRGQLDRTVDRPNLSAFTGIADTAYGPTVSRARRHVAFVDRQFWVLLDEVVSTEAEPVERRFHTEGTIEASSSSPGAWRASQNGAAVDIVIAGGPGAASADGTRGAIEHPAGWIHPVDVLSLKTGPAREHALVTVLVPQPANDSGASVRIEQHEETIDVSVATHHVRFTRDANGWRVTP